MSRFHPLKAIYNPPIRYGEPTYTAQRGIHAPGETIGGRVHTASETDTAPAIAHRKTRTIGIATETDSSIAFTHRKRRTLGIATETDAAIALSRSRRRTVGIASESDLALQVSKGLAIDPASETDSAGTVGSIKTNALGVASETDSAGAITRLLPIQIVGWDASAGDAGDSMNFSSPFSGSGRQSGDILVVFWTGTNFSNTVPSAPSGWSTLVSDRTGSNNPCAIYAKVSDGTETTQTWGNSAGGFRWMGLIARYASGWANPACAGDSSSSSSKTPATVSGVGASDMRLQMVTANTVGTLSKTGASWTDQVTPQVGSFHGGSTMGVGCCSSVGSGASPSFSWSNSTAIFWGTGQIVLQP